MKPDCRSLDTAEEMIPEKEVLLLCRELIRIPSVMREETECAKFVYSKLSGWGFSPEFVEVEGYGASVFAEAGDKSAPAVVLNGHIDTVPVAEGWTRDPFGAVIENGMLYGLGALDMKSGIAGLMLAFRALAEAGLPGNSRVIFQAATGEEFSCAGTRAMAEAGFFKGAEYAIVGEGFGGLKAITIGRRGAEYFDFEVKGRTAHGACPEKGVNAISDAARIVCALDSLRMRRREDLTDEEFGPLSESQTILGISGKKEELSVPDRCTLKVLRSTIPGGSGKVLSELEATVEGLHLRSEVDIRLVETPGDRFAPYVTPPNSELVSAMKDAVVKMTGEEPSLVIGKSEADDNVIARDVRIPVICFGPGESGALARYHQPDEAISVEQLGPAAMIYFMAASELCHRLGGKG